MEKEDVLFAMKELWEEVVEDDPECRYNVRSGLLRLAVKLGVAAEYSRLTHPWYYEE